MRFVIGALALAVFAGPALAQDAADASSAGQDAVSQRPSTTTHARTLYVCDSSALTRRGFTREFGSAEFVKAEAALSRGGTWQAPKCISRVEARRLKMKLASAR